MPKNMLSVAAKKRGMVTLSEVVSMAMVTAFRNITTKMAMLKALVCTNGETVCFEFNSGE